MHLLTTILALLSPSLRLCTGNAHVHTVHLVFSHHLDVGLNEALRYVGVCDGFATKIIQEYFDEFIPKAISLAHDINGDLKDSDNNGRFAYTIHPWIASLYVDCIPWEIQDGCPILNPGKLKCPDSSKVAEFDAAVHRGDLLWADSPFNVNAGVVGEPGMFEALFDIAEALNERYNLTKKNRVWSNIDVPGFARSSIPLLKQAGATALSVCANVGNTHGESGAVPIEFVRNNNATMWRWHDPISDEEILVLYHKAQRDTTSRIPLSSEFNTYGGFTRKDNTIVTTSGVALATFIAADNTGPPSSTREVEAIFQSVRAIYPNATTIFGSTWDQFVSDIDAAEIETLPRFSSAWGDQWVSGMSSDPGRIATYRAIIRARASCITSGKCHVKDPVVRNFTRFVAKNAEHTQGVEGGGNEPGSQLCIWLALIHLPCTADKYWKNAAFEAVHNTKRNIFPGADDSWLEDRLFSTLAVNGVPKSHPLSSFLLKELNALSATKVNRVKRVNTSHVSIMTFANKTTVTCNGTELYFSNESGSLLALKFGHGGSSWSNLMDYRYLTYRMATHHGVVCNESTCPNPIPGAWSPSLLAIRVDPNQTCSVRIEVGFNSTLHNDYGAPFKVSVVYDIESMLPKMNVTLTWYNKTSTRLSEATTLFQKPDMMKGYRWEIDKLGEWVAASNVTKGGMQYQHALWSGIRYVEKTQTKGLWIHTLDAGLVCPILNQVADPQLTPEVALEESCDKYDIKSVKDPHYQIQLSDAMIDGMGIHLHGNLFDISGFPQWYPFGIGDRYQEEDAMEQFRFLFEEH